jgi:hypothetical protein
LLNPSYNILKYGRSSLGYKHSLESINKMKGPRPLFKLSNFHKKAISKAAKLENLKRKLNLNYQNLINSKIKGKTIYIYNKNGELMDTFTSINKFKIKMNISLHHNTIYKRINENFIFNNSFIASLNKLTVLEVLKIFNSVNKLNNKLSKEGKTLLNKTIYLQNVINPELSITLPSFNKAASYIKTIEGSVDKVTMRKYIKNKNLYKDK